MSLNNLPAPERTFASDNSSGALPVVLEAMLLANSGHVLAYGDDPYTKHAQRAFDDLFGRHTDTYFVWGGSGGNVMALATMWHPAGAVVCTDSAHIHVDETASPERVVGIKLLTCAHENGKLRPEHIASHANALGVQHHAQPCAVSITQATEYGTVYTVDEIAQLCETAHRFGMKVHLDGARIANAVASLGGGVETLREMTVDTGIDVLTFGGTKNGMVYGEAVVYLDSELARHAIYARKQVGQLPSKMRFVAAQFSAVLDNDTWLRSAEHANAMTRRLFDQVRDLDGLDVDPPQANSLYPILDRSVAERLRVWCPFYEWDHSRSQYRWMTAWDTTAEDVDRFSNGIRAALVR